MVLHKYFRPVVTQQIFTTLRWAWERVHGEIRHIRHMSCYLDGKDLWPRCRVGNLLVAEFPSSLGLNDVGVF